MHHLFAQAIEAVAPACGPLSLAMMFVIQVQLSNMNVKVTAMWEDWKKNKTTEN